MFGEAGHLYVYFTYGMHWGSNVVCGEVGEGVAVLLRAIEPLLGLERMRELRPAARRDHDLASGPGKLSQAFGLADRSFDGADLVTGNHGIVIASDGLPPPEDPVVGPRIGITRAVDFPGVGTSVITVTYRSSHVALPPQRGNDDDPARQATAPRTAHRRPTLHSPWRLRASSWLRRGDARASHCAGRTWYPETLHWPPPCRHRSNSTEPARPPHIGITPPWRYITARTLA